MNGSERELLNRLIESFTRVGSVADARRSVLEMLSEFTASTAHLVELESLQRGVLHDIRHGPLFRGTKFSTDLTKFLWCNPVLPHLPRLRELQIFRQREIVGTTLWYQSTYYNEFFKPYRIDDSVVMMFLRSSYAFASARPVREPMTTKTMRFLNYLHPLIENGLLNLKQWDDRWLTAGAVQRIAENTLEAIAALRNGKLLAATGPARTILGLDRHGETGNVWLRELLTQAAQMDGESSATVFVGATGQTYRLSALRAPYADSRAAEGGDGVLLVRFFPVQPSAPSSGELRMRARELGLSDREADVMAMAIRGSGAREIAHALGVAYNTARAHLRNAYAKLQVSNRIEAVNRLAGAERKDG